MNNRHFPNKTNETRKSYCWYLALSLTFITMKFTSVSQKEKGELSLEHTLTKWKLIGWQQHSFLPDGKRKNSLLLSPQAWKNARLYSSPSSPPSPIFFFKAHQRFAHENLFLPVPSSNGKHEDVSRCDTDMIIYSQSQLTD